MITPYRPAKIVVATGRTNCRLQWSERPGPGQDSILEQVLKKSVGAARQSNGRKEQTSFCIVDSQSVKNTDTAGHKGYDAGKKVSGIKRHIAVDTQGLPHAIHVTTADVTDRGRGFGDV